MNEHDLLERALARMGPSSLDLDAVQRRKARRHVRRRVTAAATAVAVMVLTGALFLTSFNQASPVVPGEPSPSTAMPSSTFSDFPSFVDLRGVAANDTGFVAYADTSLGDDTDPVWFSPDGIDWQRAPMRTGPDSPSLWGAVGPDGFVVVGVDGQGRPAAWSSSDGLAWTKGSVELPAALGDSDAMFGVTTVGNAYLAWGRVGDDAYVWRSADGHTWSSIADERVFSGAGEQFILWVDAADPGFYLAGGRDGVDRNGATRYATWTSIDSGASWTKGPTTGLTAFQDVADGATIADPSTATNADGTVTASIDSTHPTLTFTPAGPGAAEASSAPTTTSSSLSSVTAASGNVYDGFPSWVDLRAVAAGPTGFVAVGDTSNGDNTDPVWFSPDGTTWERAPKTTGPRSPNLWDVIADDHGFSAVGLDQQDDPAAWYSTDGLTWDLVPVDLHEPSGYMTDMSGVTRIGDTYLAWGWMGTLDAYIWRSPDGRAWSALPDESVFAGAGEQTILWIGTDDRGTIYAGGRERGSNATGNGDPALWRSTDGTTWERVQTSWTAFDDLRRSLTIRDRTVASNDLGEVRVGSPSTGSGGSSLTFTPAGS